MQLLNAWYAVALASGLQPDQPLTVHLHGQALVLWRGPDGTPLAAPDRCPHKGASLGRGCLVEGRLRCGYHGWSFNDQGRCVDVPANREGMSIPHRAHLRPYPCREGHGFVWVWWHQQADLDPATVPPLPPIEHVPGAQDPGWRTMEGSAVWSAHWLRILEGFIDLTHVPYVHKGTFGGAAADELYPAAESATADSLYAQIDTPRDRQYRADQGGNPLSRLRRTLLGSGHHDDEPDPVDHPQDLPVNGAEAASAGVQHVNLWMANFLLIRVVFKDFSIYLCLIPVPLGDGRTQLLWRHFRSFLRSPLADGAALKRVQRFLEEDRTIVESMQPFAPDLDGREDLLLAHDSMSLRLRKLLRAKREAGLVR